MRIEYENEELEAFILHGIASGHPYKKFRSNRRLRQDLDKVMRIMGNVGCCSDLKRYGALHYEPLLYDRQGTSSVRVGFKSKYRLIFTEHDDGIRICLIELDESHYGDE